MLLLFTGVSVGDDAMYVFIRPILSLAPAKMIGKSSALASLKSTFGKYSPFYTNFESAPVTSQLYIQLF